MRTGSPALGLTDGRLLSSRQGPLCPATTGEDRKDPPCPAGAQEGEEALEFTQRMTTDGEGTSLRRDLWPDAKFQVDKSAATPKGAGERGKVETQAAASFKS